jgi:uncharacterized surface protein with fasciclin (FAS1) repeats
MSLVVLPAASQELDLIDLAKKEGQFSTLTKALQAANLVNTLKGKGPFTLFAPTDEAFEKLPEGKLNQLLQDTSKLKEILLYHVVSGNVLANDVVKLKEAKTVSNEIIKIKVNADGVLLNDSSNVIRTDVLAKNGTIHIIDTVLMPRVKARKTLVSVAKSAGLFTKLLESATKANLIATLESKGPFTLFAPTDEAFAKLPPDTLDSLLQDIPQLTDLLLYHVVEGQFLSKKIVQLKEIKTMNQKKLAIQVKGNNVLVDNAKAIQTDVEAENGVIHFIDTVLIPPVASLVQPVGKLNTYLGSIKSTQ